LALQGGRILWLALVVVLLLPYLLIYSLGLRTWAARAIGDGILVYSATAVSKKPVFVCEGNCRSTRSYALFYCIGGPEVGRTYEFTFFPGSQLLPDAKEIR
jgi:hypothetical protein